MKIAYLLNWELSSQDGVSKKVYAQSHAWQSLGHDVKVFCILKNKVASFGEVAIEQVIKAETTNILQEFKSVYNAYQKTLLLLEQYQPDIIYFRFDIYQPALKPILKKFATIIEINTNDVEELKLIASQSLRGKIRYFYHLMVRNSYLNMVSGFCCVTYEISNLPSIRKFKKPVFVIPNAINSFDYSCPNLNHKPESGIPRLVFIGSPNQAWHGLDKLMDLAQRTIDQLQFDIIGTKGELFKEVPPNVCFHGYLKKQEYQNLLCACDIGVCTLGLHRNNMEEASPLKTREYLAFGLPIILGYKDTAFMKTGLPSWALELPNSETNLLDNVDTILDFCYKHKSRKLSKEETFQYIDSSIYEKLRLEYLSKI